MSKPSRRDDYWNLSRLEENEYRIHQWASTVICQYIVVYLSGRYWKVWQYESVYVKGWKKRLPNIQHIWVATVTHWNQENASEGLARVSVTEFVEIWARWGENLHEKIILNVKSYCQCLSISRMEATFWGRKQPEKDLKREHIARTRKNNIRF